MKFESLAPDLQSWFRDMVKRGSDRDGLIRSLRTAGYQERYARDAVEAAFKALPVPPPPPPAQAPPPTVIESTPDAAAEAQTLSEQLVQMPNTIETGDRAIHMLFALTAPRIVLFGNLLSIEECEQMIELSRGKLARSSVVNNETGAYDIHPHRTSYWNLFQPRRERTDPAPRAADRRTRPVSGRKRRADPDPALRTRRRVQASLRLLRPEAAGQRAGADAGRPAHRDAGHVPERRRGRRLDGVSRRSASMSCRAGATRCTLPTARKTARSIRVHCTAAARWDRARSG